MSSVRDDEGTTYEPIDPLRAALLGACATFLAIAFFALLIADQASALTF